MPHVKKIFLEKAEGYTETIACVTRLGMIRQINGTFQLGINWVAHDEYERRDIVLRCFLESRNRYKSDIFRFIRKFHIANDNILYFSTTTDLLDESAVRNFLMEMNIVRYEIGTSKYSLMLEYVNLYAQAQDEANYMSLSTLEKNISNNHEIGFLAEELILAYERDRVGSRFSDKVEHISQKNVAAGYDIRSITLRDNAEVALRFIEVKAVSDQSYQFYWSRNEISVAQNLGHCYYLYLLPLAENRKFDIDKLKIISDPYNVVMVADTVWACKTDTIVCFLKSMK